MCSLQGRKPFRRSAVASAEGVALVLGEDLCDVVSSRDEDNDILCLMH